MLYLVLSTVNITFNCAFSYILLWREVYKTFFLFVLWAIIQFKLSEVISKEKIKIERFCFKNKQLLSLRLQPPKMNACHLIKFGIKRTIEIT